MKKQFFYAAFAIALMASCSNEDNLVVDPVNPTPEVEDKVAIELGITNNVMEIGSRGTGIVGGVEGEDDASKWDNQELFVVMVNKNDGAKTQENDAYIFEGLKFKAPKADAANDLIEIYTNANYTDYQWKYYPITGAYDFYGYHVDDAATNGGTLTVTDLTTATVSGIVIDGTQDIMAAKTLEVNATNYPGLDLTDKNPFSAKSARNEIKPKLNFTHELARLKFFVKSGKGSDAAINYVDKNKNDITRNDKHLGEEHDMHKYSDGAIYVTGVSVLNMYKDIELNLVEQSASIAENAEIVADGFTLRSKPAAGATDKDLIELIPTAPEYAENYTNIPQGKEATEIGESIMFLPVSNDEGTGSDKQVTIKVNVGQCLVNTEDVATGDKEYYWDEPDPVYLTLKAKDIDNADDANAVFKPGYSYNVYITIYGRERIEISANLVPWEDGGDIESDIENGSYTDPTTNSGNDDDENLTT